MNIAMMLQIKSYKHSITLDFKKHNFHTLPRQRPDENGMIKGYQNPLFSQYLFPKA